MITYGHEDYIEQAINSVLLQEANFPIELILSNDCSPDNTDSVIRSLINSHPKGYLIKYFNHGSNLGMHKNFFFAMSKCTGKYICFCEGDDYWTDRRKLQVQYDVLERDENIALVHTDYDIFYQRESLLKKNHNLGKVIPSGHIYNELIVDNFIATLTAMIRKSQFDEILDRIYDFSKGLPMIDYPLWLMVASKYKVTYLKSSTSCYRYLENSASHSPDVLKLIKFQDHLFQVRQFFVIIRNINVSYKYNRLAHFSKISGYKQEFFSTFVNFHKINRSLKHSIGSFYYLLRKFLL
jgi:glycosyltransferase involved in cell wall biosynthesis